MYRRDVLKRAGFASLGLAALPLLATPALAGGGSESDASRRYTYVSVSAAGTTSDGVAHMLIMEGSGSFDPMRHTVTGRGIFVHFNGAAPGTPKPIVSSGRWLPEEFVSYGNQIGTYGRIAPSIVQMLITLLPDGAAPIPNVTLRLICDVDAAGLDTGEPEGYKLTIPGAPYGTFEPLNPPLGITHIGTGDW